MTPEKALSILDQIAAQSSMNRTNTQLAIQAVRVLNDLVSAHPVAEVKEPTKLNKGETK